MKPPSLARQSVAGLRSITLFANMPEDALQRLYARCRWRRFPSNQCIVSRDADDCDVYFLVSGMVRVVAFSAGGRQVTYRDLHAGEWFGDLAAIDRRSRSADVVALSETLLASVSASDFLHLVTDQASAADAQLKHLADWVRDLTDRLFELSTLGVQNRVDAELLRLAKNAGVGDNVARIEPTPRHSDIASQVSTYREQVSRELSRLAKLGIVERIGRVLVVHDVARLERMVANVRRSG